MVKESLSSDIDLIKEFEQVKLKQKLLINSISQNNLTFHNQALDEINKKLDFLVTIFQQANENEQDSTIDKKLEEIQKENQENQTKIEEKISSLEENFSKILDKLDLISENLKSSNNSNSTLDMTNPQNQLSVSKAIENIQDSSQNITQNNSDDKKLEEIQKENQQNTLPPIPNFKVEENTQKEKKKKWF